MLSLRYSEAPPSSPRAAGLRRERSGGEEVAGVVMRPWGTRGLAPGRVQGSALPEPVYRTSDVSNARTHAVDE